MSDSRHIAFFRSLLSDSNEQRKRRMTILEEWNSWFDIDTRFFSITRDKISFSTKHGETHMQPSFTPSEWELILVRLHEVFQTENTANEPISVHSSSLGTVAVYAQGNSFDSVHVYSNPSVFLQEHLKRNGLTRELGYFLQDAFKKNYNFLIIGPDEKENNRFLSYFSHLIPYSNCTVVINAPKSPPRVVDGNKVVFQQEESKRVIALRKALSLRPEHVLVENLFEETLSHFANICLSGYSTCIGSLVCPTLDEVATQIRHSFENDSIDRSIEEAFDVLIHIDTNEELPLIRVYNLKVDSTSNELSLYPLFENGNTRYLHMNLSSYSRQKKQKPILTPPKQNRLDDFKKPYQIDLEDFLKAFDEQFETSYSSVSKSLVSETLGVYRELTSDKDIPVGTSKFGGQPDLPVGMEYPCINGRPYTFVFQLNCEEVKKIDKQNLLPNKGMLYLFYDFDEETLLSDIENSATEKPFHVFYAKESTEQLHRTPYPETEEEVEKVKSARIHYAKQFTMPHPYENKHLYQELGFAEEDMDTLTSFSHALRDIPYLGIEKTLESDLSLTFDKPYHHLFGYPLPAQAEPLEELKIKRPDLFIEQEEEWVLLLQLEVDEKLNLYWASDGFIYFYIRKKDLTEGEFGNILSIWQCG